MSLEIYDVSVDMVRGITPAVHRVQKLDPDLARQMRRASASVVLNLAEGMHSQGRNKGTRLYTAVYSRPTPTRGSARETIACLDVAAAAGYVAECSVSKERDRLDRIVATLYKLIHR